MEDIQSSIEELDNALRSSNKKMNTNYSSSSSSDDNVWSEGTPCCYVCSAGFPVTNLL